MNIVDEIIKKINDNFINGKIENIDTIQNYIDENIELIKEYEYQKILHFLLEKYNLKNSSNCIELFNEQPKFSILTYKKILRTKYNFLWELKKVSKSSLYVEFARKICEELIYKTVSQVIDQYKEHIIEISRYKSVEELKSLLKDYKEQLYLTEPSLVSKKPIRDYFNDFAVKSKEDFIKDNINAELTLIQNDFISIDKDKERYDMLKEQQFINLLFNSPYDTNELKKRINQLFNVELDNNELRELIHNYFTNNKESNYRLLNIDLYMDFNAKKYVDRLEQIRKYNRFKQNYLNKVKKIFNGKYDLLIEIINNYKNINEYILSNEERALINEIYWPFIKSNSVLENIDGELIFTNNEPFTEVETIALKHTENYYKKYKSLERCIDMYCAHYSEKYGVVKEVKKGELVFDDDNYTLNRGNYILNLEVLSNILKKINVQTIDNYSKETIELIKTILFKNGFLSSVYKLDNDIDLSVLINFFDYFNIKDTNNFDYEVVIKLINVYGLADRFTLALLSQEVCEKIINNKQFLQTNTESDIKLRLEKACDLAARGSLINTSAIPYNIDIEHKNVKIRRFDNDDPKLLVSGIDTNTCFKLSGNDNDFVFYTVLSKNGLALKILDEKENIIGRVSAFRHANVLFLNGVRVIENKNYVTTETIDLHKNIYEALVKYGEEIIKATTNSDLPIDFIVCNKAGILESNIFDMSEKIVSPYLVENPLDMYNDDWKKFIHTYDNVSKDYFQQVNKGETVPFVTDYGSYPAILLTSRDNKFLERKWDIKYDDPKDCYIRPRKKIIIFNENTKNNFKDLIYSISAKKCLKDCNFDLNKAKKVYRAPNLKNIIRGFIGEDWYMILHNDFSMEVAIFNEETNDEVFNIMNNIIGNISNYMSHEQEQIKKESK